MAAIQKPSPFPGTDIHIPVPVGYDTLQPSLVDSAEHSDSPSIAAAEPTAIAAMAFLGLDRAKDAQTACDWLADVQQPDGFVGINEQHSTPRWPTSLALLAWCAARNVFDDKYEQNINQAVNALLTIKGAKIDPTPDLGHDTQLVGWPWVDGTHSWVEPTALAVMGLKAAGHHEHPRVREAVTLLRNRQIHRGAWNCGNTVVLGQTQANHVQPTGMALVALANEPDPRHKKQSAIRYLRDEITRGTGTISLCWAWLALAAHDHLPADLENELLMNYRNTPTRSSPFKVAMLVLAALGQDSPILRVTR